ncbi:unnamed protein product [Brachionus calyciflorus]|uniref:Uncharacterized protein n=1 Tax=Brachionus calyciflorus TaxID=104777 RepID=A0A813MDV6_9BILA|nr:unnamed protein product [Brachionus calyciflorus]
MSTPKTESAPNKHSLNDDETLNSSASKTQMISNTSSKKLNKKKENKNKNAEPNSKKTPTSKAKKSTVTLIKNDISSETSLKNSHDFIFANHINYLNKMSFSNLVNFDNEEISRHNQVTIQKLVNKKPIKLTPELKYFTCKKCEIMLIPGETSRTRIKSKRQKHVAVSCLNCGNIKRFNFE